MEVYNKLIARKVKKKKGPHKVEELILLSEKLVKKKSTKNQFEALNMLFPFIEANRNCFNNDSKSLFSITTAIFKNVNFDNLIYFPKYWNLYRIGINNLFYNDKGGYGAYYFYENNDNYKIQLLYVVDKWTIKIDDEIKKISDLEIKSKSEKLFGEYFLTKTHILLPKNKNIDLFYDNKKVTIQNIPNVKRNFSLNKDSKIIFFDRISKADDNAEILYEQFQKLGYKNIYFIIDKNCHDWYRLHDKNFNMVSYGSKKMDLIYDNAQYIISSSLDKEIYNYKNIRYRDFGSASKYILVPHGVTLNDQSKWFDDKRIDALVSSTDFEYESFMSKYLLFEDDVVRAKMPRLEKLKNVNGQNILIHFTWRKNLDNCTNEEFVQSNYFQKIEELVCFLKNNREEPITLILHPQFSKYSTCFKFEGIEILNPLEVIYSELISNCKFLITDYSSISIDAIYIDKSVIFYQFDKYEFYSNHIYSEGDFYINKCKDNICKNLEEVRKHLLHNSEIEITYFDNECIDAIERKETL